MAPTNSSHAGSGSFESASSPPVLSARVRPHPRQTHLWVPSASRPRLATREQPHLGHSPGSPAGPPGDERLPGPLGEFAPVVFRQRERLLQYAVVHPGLLPLGLLVEP